MTAPDPLTPEERRQVNHLRAWLAKEPRSSSLACILGALDRLVAEAATAEEPLAEASTVVQRDDVHGNFIDPPRMAVPRAQPGQRLRVVALPE